MSVKKTSKKIVKKEVAKKSAIKPVAKPLVKSTVKPAATKKTAVAAKVKMPSLSSSMLSKFDAKKIEPKKLIKPLIFLLILAFVYLIKDEVIVASVNGVPVTRWSLVRNLEKQSASVVLENMTLQILVEQELKKAGIKVSDEDMDAELAKIEEQLSAQGQNLDDLLQAQGLTRASVKEQLALSKGMEMLLADKLNVTDEEAAAYFEENKEMIGDAKYEDIKSDIVAQLRQQKLSTEQQKWFAEIKKSAKINYFKFAPSINLQ